MHAPHILSSVLIYSFHSRTADEKIMSMAEASAVYGARLVPWMNRTMWTGPKSEWEDV
jgi:hypothetical protein